VGIAHPQRWAGPGTSPTGLAGSATGPPGRRPTPGVRDGERTRPSTRKGTGSHRRGNARPRVGQATERSTFHGARSTRKSALGPSGVTAASDPAQADQVSTPAGRPHPSHGRCRSRARQAATRPGSAGTGSSAFRATVVAWSSCRSASVTAGPCCSSTATATVSSARTSLGTRSVRSRGSLTPGPPLQRTPSRRARFAGPHAGSIARTTMQAFGDETADVGRDLNPLQSRLVQRMRCASRQASASIGPMRRCSRGWMRTGAACLAGNCVHGFAAASGSWRAPS
jgi:hypothetical protein